MNTNNEIKTFIDLYKEAFGPAVPLPVAFGYSRQPATEVQRVPRCIVGAISEVRHGDPLTLSADNVTCGGGLLYTGFAPMSEHIPEFVSETERYKQTKEMVLEKVKSLDIKLSDKPYLNFIRLDRLDSFDEIEGLIFFATPDILSGLCSWTFFDNNAEDAVCTPFGSGCSTMVTHTVKENRQNGRRCFIGMFDPSARVLMPANELTFTIPLSRFREMMATLPHTALFKHAFSVIRKRINRDNDSHQPTDNLPSS